MKLPDFTDDPDLNALRRKMGADALGSFSPGYRPETLSLAELEELASAGKEVSIDEVIPLEDGTLSYKNGRVILYIRDVIAYGDQHFEPRFHIADCTTLIGMKQQKKFATRYVVATRADGKFMVRITEGDRFEDSLMVLKVCQNCLRRLNFDNFSNSISKEKKEKIVRQFTIPRFFEIYPVSLFSERPEYDSDTAPINDYLPSFRSTSARIKAERGWACEKCHRDLSAPSHRKYLHVHHKNGLKYDDAGSNLQVLCIGCHARQPQHAHLKETLDYRRFVLHFPSSLS